MQVGLHREGSSCKIAFGFLISLLVITCILVFPSQAQAHAGTDSSEGATLSATKVVAQGSTKVAKTSETKLFNKPGYYCITVAKNKNKMFGPKNGSRVNGVNVVMSKKANTNLLRFRLIRAGKGLFYIVNTATSRVLTAEVASSGKTGKAVMRDLRGKIYAKRYQIWQVTVNADKTVSFKNPRTGLRLSLFCGKTKVGTPLKLRKEADANYQKFSLIKTKKYQNEVVKLDVPCYDQYPELPSGCESVALTNALNYWGFKLRKTTISDKWIPYGNDGIYTYIGNPRSEAGWIISAPGITRTANKYLSTKSTTVEATNVTGTSLKKLCKYIEKGCPVIVWTTLNMGSPWSYSGSKTVEGHRYPFYHNNHTVVLAGYNPKNGKYLVADSVSGTVWRNGNSFTSLYNKMGKQAVVLSN